MSQHYLDAEINSVPVLVQMGWDKPLRQFYLVVFEVGEDGSADELVYSNLDDDSAPNAPLKYFVSVLDRLGIKTPLAMIDEIERDKRNNTVNRVVQYASDGQIIKSENLSRA